MEMIFGRNSNGNTLGEHHASLRIFLMHLLGAHDFINYFYELFAPARILIANYASNLAVSWSLIFTEMV